MYINNLNDRQIFLFKIIKMLFSAISDKIVHMNNSDLNYYTSIITAIIRIIISFYLKYLLINFV